MEWYARCKVDGTVVVRLKIYGDGFCLLLCKYGSDVGKLTHQNSIVNTHVQLTFKSIGAAVDYDLRRIRTQCLHC